MSGQFSEMLEALQNPRNRQPEARVHELHERNHPLQRWHKYCHPHHSTLASLGIRHQKIQYARKTETYKHIHLLIQPIVQEKVVAHSDSCKQAARPRTQQNRTYVSIATRRIRRKEAGAYRGIQCLVKKRVEPISLLGGFFGTWGGGRGHGDGNEQSRQAGSGEDLRCGFMGCPGP